MTPDYEAIEALLDKRDSIYDADQREYRASIDNVARVLLEDNKRLRDTIQAVLDRADQYDRAGQSPEWDGQPLDIVATFRAIALGVSDE